MALGTGAAAGAFGAFLIALAQLAKSLVSCSGSFTFLDVPEMKSEFIMLGTFNKHM